MADMQYDATGPTADVGMSNHAAELDYDATAGDGRRTLNNIFDMNY
jgi:hypothetical protein